ncbi:MAG: M14 family metallopeptidase [Candidatus Aminicenantes bacterium]|nr:M14 family metallopeptidase [Candidatus Aminicenantes bacterium]
MEKDGRIYIVADSEVLASLEGQSVSFTLETRNFPQNNPSNVSIQGGVNGDFHSYIELERDLLDLEKNFPDLAKVFDIGDSLESRNIYALKISDNVLNDEDEAEGLFLGCHHAREWISVEVPYLFGKYLLENYHLDGAIKNIVDHSEIWIVPLVNPDGLEYSIHYYRYWRKNRRDNGDGTFGIDINRNYGYQWGYDNNGSSPSAGSETYRGTAPFSEPESLAIRDLFSQHNFLSIISYHSYGSVILYPWGYTFQPTGQDALLNDLASNMSQQMQTVNGTVYSFGPASGSLYTTNGDTTDWSFGIYGIPSFTIELPPPSSQLGEFFNAEEDIQPIFQENLKAALYLIEWAIQNKPSPKDSQENIQRRPRSKVTNTLKK